MVRGLEPVSWEGRLKDLERRIRQGGHRGYLDNTFKHCLEANRLALSSSLWTEPGMGARVGQAPAKTEQSLLTTQPEKQVIFNVYLHPKNSAKLLHLHYFISSS